MSFKYYKNGKDGESLPCIELNDGTVIDEPHLVYALIKALVAKGTLTVANIKAQL